MHVKTSQPNQTRPRKKGATSTKVPRHKTRGIPHNPTHPFEGQTGSPSVPRSAPKREKPPIAQGSAPDLFQMVFSMLAHTRQISQINPTRLIIHQLPRQKILVRLEIQQSMTTIVEHYHLPLPSLLAVLRLIHHILDHVSRLRSRNHTLRSSKRPRCLEHFILMILHRPHHLPIDQIT